MGLPISKFQILADLCSSESALKRYFTKFKLVCIVLHDPDDVVFTRKMQNQFASLHEQTGEDLLFISFIDPPYGWRESWEIDQELFYKRNINVERDFDSWLIINHFLPVVASDSKLPCLLVTHDLLSREYVLIESSIHSFQWQLKQLGQYCTHSREHFPVSDGRFQEYVSGLGPSQYFTLLEHSIAEEMASTLALKEIRSNNRQASMWAKRRYSELKEKAHAVGKDNHKTICLYNSYATDFNGWKYAAESSSYYKSCAHDTRDTESSYVNKFYLQTKKIQGFLLCDTLSRGNIHQYNSLLSYCIALYPKGLSELQHPFFQKGDDGFIFSFKQLAFPLTEFFERELNLTLVQQMRLHMGIEMPDYYRRFKKNCYAVINTDKNTISLNACEYPDKLKPVMTGQAYYAYKALCDLNGSYLMEDKMGQRFMGEWYKLAKLRNDIDHAEYEEDDVFNFEDFDQYFNLFTSVLENSLWKMEEIGQALSKGDALPAFK